MNNSKGLGDRNKKRLHSWNTPPLSFPNTCQSLSEESDWSRLITWPSFDQRVPGSSTESPTQAVCGREGKLPRGKLNSQNKGKHRLVGSPMRVLNRQVIKLRHYKSLALTKLWRGSVTFPEQGTFTQRLSGRGFCKILPIPFRETSIIRSSNLTL